MTALTDFIADFRQKAYIVSFCTSKNIFAVKAPKNKSIVNSIVYNQIYNIRDSYFSGSFGLYKMLLELNLFSKSYPSMDATANSIIDEYHGNSFILGSTNFQKIVIYSNTTELQSIDDNVYRYSFDIEFTY